jgi:hypothetical protein
MIVRLEMMFTSFSFPSKHAFVAWTETVSLFNVFRLEVLKWPVPVVARSKAICRLLELRVRIRPGAWMAGWLL